MIYIVTLNPSIDYIVKLEDLEIGETNRAYYDAKIPGGKGIMVSKLLQSLGIESSNIGFIGGKTGDFIEESLKEMKIKSDFTKIRDDTRINVKIKAQKETEINARGPVIKEKEIEDFFKKLVSLKEEDIIVLSGSIPYSLGRDFYIDIIKEIKKKNIEFIIDTRGKELAESMMYKPLLVKPNKDELEEFFNVKINKLDEIPAYGKRLIDLGANSAIVSLGKDGAMFFNGKESYYAYTVKGDLVNSVGAGDSMIGGFLYGLEKGFSKLESFKWAVASGSATAFSEDIGSKELITALYKEIRIEKIV